MQEVLERLKKAEVVFFDWDNTIVNSWGVIHHSLNSTFVQMGKEPISQENLRSDKSLHRSLREFFPEVFGERWQEARQNYYDIFTKCHLEKIALLQGAEDFLQAIHNEGVHMIIISNKTGKYLRAEAEHLGLAKYFKNIVGATDAKKDKPSKIVVEFALKNFDGQITEELKQNMFFIGDSLVDIETALKFGCHPVRYGLDICGNELWDLQTKYCYPDDVLHIEKYEIIKPL